MPPRELTREDLEWLFTSPGCDFTTDNGKNGHCAMGKFDAFNLWDTHEDLVYINNLGKTSEEASTEDQMLMAKGWGTNNDDPLRESYGKDDPRWNKHERALKLNLGYLLGKGLASITPELQKEYGLVNS